MSLSFERTQSVAIIGGGPGGYEAALAAAQLGVEPQATVAIGDSENDALAGRAAGMATLTVPYGYNHGQAIQTIKSDGIVDSLLGAAKAIAAHQSTT